MCKKNVCIIAIEYIGQVIMLGCIVYRATCCINSNIIGILEPRALRVFIYSSYINTPYGIILLIVLVTVVIMGELC